MTEPASMRPDPSRAAPNPTRDDGATLVLNAGSSSLKYEVLDRAEHSLARGSVKRIGGEAVHEATFGAGEPAQSRVDSPDHRSAVQLALAALAQHLGNDWTKSIEAVGHRVVHGGSLLWEPTLVDDAAIETLVRQMDLTPLHSGPSIRAILAARAALPEVPQIAVFDTGFHHDLPRVARTYALPLDLSERLGLRRYGFHGISCQYLVRRVAELGIEPSRRMIICHLGAGASLTAVLDGRSTDTSMGFTPLDGLVMATRAGDLDPGILIYLQRHAGLDVDALDGMLERESGLLGLSGYTGDYAQLEARAQAGDSRASFALESFAYRVRSYLGAYAAVLGGIDLVVLSGGIGEHSSGARTAILEPLAALGWSLDPGLNRGDEPERRVSAPGTRPQIWVIPTREELAIARDCWTLLDEMTSRAAA